MFFFLTVRTIGGWSVATVSFICRVLAEQFLDRGDVFGRSTPALILPEDDIPQFPKIVEERTIVISPVEFIGVFGLEMPDAPELRHAHFALSPVRVFLLPYVLTPHPAGILH